MLRVKEITSREQVAEDEREFFDQVAALRGEIRLPYSVYLNHPPLAVRKLHIGSYVRFETSLPADVSEVAICTAAREVDCDFEWYAHSRGATRAGVSEQTLEAIKSRGDAAAKEVEAFGCEILSKPGERPVKFRMPGGPIAEIVRTGSFAGGRESRG